MDPEPENATTDYFYCRHYDNFATGNASAFDLITSSCVDNSSIDTDELSGRGPSPPAPPISYLTLVFVVSNGIIYIVGLAGNAMVVYAIGRYIRMKTVTNVYILNLAITDTLFLLGLPMIMATSVLKRWVFGAVLCRVYYALTCVNIFTGTFTLTLMSGDRFVAVWFPVSSLRYRTPRVSAALSAGAWLISLIVMFPVVLYAEQLPNASASPSSSDASLPPPVPAYSCTVQWPAKAAAQAYIVYMAVIGFAIPVALICTFYTLLVVRLRRTQRHIRSSSSNSVHQRTVRRSVTFLVTSVIVVFIVCWLPYWAFQVHAVFGSSGGLMPNWKIYMFMFFTILSYVNSAVNPFLYAFTNDVFKTAFATACGCASGQLANTTDMGSTRGRRGRRSVTAGALGDDSIAVTPANRRSVGGCDGGQMALRVHQQRMMTQMTIAPEVDRGAADAAGGGSGGRGGCGRFARQNTEYTTDFV